MGPLDTTRAAFGLSLLIRPELAAGSLGASLDPSSALLARVLGVRHLVQATLLRSRRAHRAGAVVDGLHAASMLALATRDERHRRICLTNAATAGMLSLASLVSPD